MLCKSDDEASELSFNFYIKKRGGGERRARDNSLLFQCHHFSNLSSVFQLIILNLF